MDGGGCCEPAAAAYSGSLRWSLNHAAEPSLGGAPCGKVAFAASGSLSRDLPDSPLREAPPESELPGSVLKDLLPEEKLLELESELAGGLSGEGGLKALLIYGLMQIFCSVQLCSLHVIINERSITQHSDTVDYSGLRSASERIAAAWIGSWPCGYACPRLCHQTCRIVFALQAKVLESKIHVVHDLLLLACFCTTTRGWHLDLIGNFNPKFVLAVSAVLEACCLYCRLLTITKCHLY
jgi:hypothetical protein